MPCATITLPTPPTLPTGFAFIQPLPGIPDLSLRFCCQIKLSDYITLPIPPPALVFPISAPVLATINQVLLQGQQAAQAYIDRLVPKCPRF
jgi:hypothetical protein